MKLIICFLLYILVAYLKGLEFHWGAFIILGLIGLLYDVLFELAIRKLKE